MRVNQKGLSYEGESEGLVLGTILGGGNVALGDVDGELTLVIKLLLCEGGCVRLAMQLVFSMDRRISNKE